MAPIRKDGKHDDPLAGVTARALRRTGAPASACPDPSVVAAYFERSLTDAEVAQHGQHFAACARCQQQLAVMARLETAVPAGVADPSRAAERRGWRRAWNWKIWAPAAVAFGALALWIAGTADMQRAPALVSTQVAENRPLESAPQAAASGSSALSADALARKDAPAKPASDESDTSKKNASTTRGKRDESMLLAGRSADEVKNAGLPREMVAPPPPPPGRQAAAEEKALAKLETLDEAKLRDAQKSKEVTVMAERAAAPAAAPPAAAPAPQVAAPAEQQRAQAQSDSNATQQTLQRQRQQQEQENRGFAGALSTNRVMKMSAANEILIHAPAPSLALWRVTAGSRLEKSADSGGTWQAQKLPAGVSILAGSAPTDKVVWLVGRAGVVLRTTDGGDNWQKLAAPANVDLTAIEARDADSATVVAADGRRFVTSDAGRTWKLL